MPELAPLDRSADILVYPSLIGGQLQEIGLCTLPLLLGRCPTNCLQLYQHQPLLLQSRDRTAVELGHRHRLIISGHQLLKHFCLHRSFSVQLFQDVFP